MAKQVLIDVRLFAGPVDLSGNSNKVEVEDKLEVKPVTNFRSGGAREVIAGAEEVSISAEGQWEATDPTSAPYDQDDGAWASRRVVEPISISADGSGDLSTGGLVYLTQALRSNFKMFGQIGEVAPWSGDWSGSWPLVRGVVAHPSGVARTATGNGIEQNLGAIPAGKSLYAALHVLSVAGTSPSLTIDVKSDDNASFTSPIVRGSFAAATAKGGQAIKISGPVTDNWWKISYTISGTTPSFLFLATFGIA